MGVPVPVPVPTGRRRIVLGISVTGCVAVIACSLAVTHAARKPPSTGRLSAASVISPQLLAATLADPRATMNVGPVPVSGFRAPYSDCATPTRGALRWLTLAHQASLYDMSTYLDDPATVRTVASFYAIFTGAVPDPLAATMSGLRDCRGTGRIVTVATATGRRRAVRFTLSPPMGNVCTLVAVRDGNAVLAVVVSHAPTAPRADIGADGLVPSERAIVNLALARAYGG